MVAEYILSSKPIQCLIPNVVVFEEISRIDIEMDELVGDDSDEDTDEMEDAHDNGEAEAKWVLMIMWLFLFFGKLFN